jgi:hypothetical protein
MSAVTSGGNIIREDLSRALILIDMKKTVFFSRLKKGEKLKALEFSYGIETMGERRTDPIPENMDVDAFEGDSQRKLWQRAQKFWRTPRVSTEMERIIDTPAETKGRMKDQTKKKTSEQKRDIETVMLSDQDAKEDRGIKNAGYAMMGAGRFINDGTLAFGDQLTAIPADLRTPAAQIYTGLLADLDEDDFKAILKSIADNTGNINEFTLFAGSTLKQHISDNFGNYRPNKEGYSVVVRTQTQAVDKRKFMAAVVDIYEGEFGIFDVEWAQYLPSPKRGYLMDMDNTSMRPGFYLDYSELPYQGGGTSALIESILSWEGGHPQSHGKIAPSDE